LACWALYALRITCKNFQSLISSAQVIRCKFQSPLALLMTQRELFLARKAAKWLLIVNAGSERRDLGGNNLARRAQRVRRSRPHSHRSSGGSWNCGAPRPPDARTKKEPSLCLFLSASASAVEQCQLLCQRRASRSLSLSVCRVGECESPWSGRASWSPSNQASSGYPWTRSGCSSAPNPWTRATTSTRSPLPGQFSSRQAPPYPHPVAAVSAPWDAFYLLALARALDRKLPRYMGTRSAAVPLARRAESCAINYTFTPLDDERRKCRKVEKSSTARLV
jgi:hypothetical protein